MPLPVIIALTADEARVGLRPGIEPTLRTGKRRLAGFLYPYPRCPSPSTRHARSAKRWQGRGVAPGSAGSLGHALHPLAMRSPGGAALGVRADPRRGHQAAGGHGGAHAVGGKDSREKWLCISYTFGNRSAGIGRRVSVWDRLEVNGILFVNGNVGIGTNGPTHRFHVLAPDAVGLFESTGTQAYLRLSTSEGINNRVEITNRPGGRLTLWTAGAGDVFTISRDGQIFLGNNRTGPFVRLNDDMWFSDPQNGTIHVRNGNNSNWGTLVGIFNNQSSRAYKKTITALQAPDCDRLLNDALHTNLVTFRYKGDDEQHRLRLGVISEESPSYIVGDDGESLSSSEYIAMLHGAIKALANRLVALEEKVAAITG